MVGCYAPVYGDYSPQVFYSPGAPINAPAPSVDPGPSTGTETVSLPQIEPWDSGEGLLLGAYVWFECGEWRKFNGKYYWVCEYTICDWYWVPNPGGSCFSPGTHLLTPEGSKPIEQFAPGDLILASPKADIAASPSPRRIERVVKRQEELLQIVVNGKKVNTTAGHPFLTSDRGWVPAASLVVGESLRSHDNHCVLIESLQKGPESTVFNVVVDGVSAYFVGEKDWPFAICASDACDHPLPPLENVTRLMELRGGQVRK